MIGRSRSLAIRTLLTGVLGGGALTAVACPQAASIAILPALPPGTFLAQIHQTGAVGPPYYHTDTLLVDHSGAWTATRRFPYARPPFETMLASGTISVPQMNDLRAQAVVPPASGGVAFAELPAASGQLRPGAGEMAMAISLPDGQLHQVTVQGAAPPAFEQLDAAVASATVDMSSIGPFRAPGASS